MKWKPFVLCVAVIFNIIVSLLLLYFELYVLVELPVLITSQTDLFDWSKIHAQIYISSLSIEEGPVRTVV